MQSAPYRASLTLYAFLLLASCFCRAQAPDLANSSKAQHRSQTAHSNSTDTIGLAEQSRTLKGASNSTESAVTAPLQTYLAAEQADFNFGEQNTCSNLAVFPPAAEQKDYCPAALATKSSGTATNEAGQCGAASDTSSETPAPHTTGPAQVVFDTQNDQQQISQQQDPEETDSTDEDRHNFALSKDGAKIVACNREAKKCSAILDTDSDTFMRNDCKADKWFIVELSQVAKVDTLQLSQYELYSSRVKDFEVRGRQSHPRAQGADYSKALNTSGWQLLGKYTAAKMRGSQAFTVAQPVWLKYLQFHFITHHGSEAMCALNDVLIFGKSAAEDLEDQLSADALLPDVDPQSYTAKSGSSPKDSLDPQPDPKISPRLEDQQHNIGSGQPPRPVAGTAVPAQQSHGSTQAPKTNPGQQNLSVPASSVNLSDAVDQQSRLPEIDTTDEKKIHQATTEALSISTPPSVSAAFQNGSIPGSPAVGPLTSPDIAQGNALQEELLLLPNSASSNKARHGGSIYDMLVQEIKSLKLQQKLATRQLAELQKNISADLNQTRSETRLLHQALQVLQAEFGALQQSTSAANADPSVATSSDPEIDLQAVLGQMDSVKMALHIVQHRVTAIVLMAIVAWLAVMVLTAPDLGRMTWILYVPMLMICAIGVLWLAGMLRILPNHFTVR